jgi:hypothetical protein
MFLVVLNNRIGQCLHIIRPAALIPFSENEMSAIGGILTTNHNLQRQRQFGFIFCCGILHHIDSANLPQRLQLIDRLSTRD